jgi:hypothetical protein
MDDKEKPDLPLYDQTTITEERYNADREAWQAFREILRPKKWNESTRFDGPRPPKETAKFYLYLSNYSNELFFLEANRYPQYPPNPNSRNWLINLAQRVEDHAIRAIRDLAASNPEKDFSYHNVAEDEMRRTIQQRLAKEMKDHFPIEFPRPTPVPPRAPGSNAVTPETIARARGQNVARPAPTAGESFGKALDDILRENNIRPEALAERMEIEWSTVYRHISGKHWPNRDSLKRYAEALSGILGYSVKLPTPPKRQRSKKPQQ